MIELVKEKKVFSRLVLLLLITIPLFGLLGGTPFLTFNYRELSNFLPGIYFVAFSTLLFWMVNIALFVLSEKISVMKKILLRALVSVIAGVTISTTVFYFVQLDYPRPMRIERDGNGNDRIINFTVAGKSKTLRFSEKDSNLVFMEPPGFKMPPRHFFFFPQMVRSLTINLIILTLCELVFLYYRKQKIELENIRLRQYNLEARNNQLKMQLHPHFLFNSLNTLRLLLKKDADKAEDYLMKLSEILRYSTNSAQFDVVDVKDELKLCLNYLEMQQVRFGDMIAFGITNEKLLAAKGKLPVYSLQLLAENAIKHNAFTNEMPLKISIDYDEAASTITISNPLQPRKIMEVTTKVGLKNLEERYRLLGNEGITIVNSNNIFSVTIKVLHPTNFTVKGV
ncbi:MAG: sensor histidine kinase [Bacteroidetes bacterium]|nr:sensor histidine kinase [Bacteroidota bacterium]